MPKPIKFDIEANPQYFIFQRDYDQNSLDIQQSFNKTGELYLEIGSGNGHFLVEKAKMNPDKFFIGCEIKIKRIAKAARKTKFNNLTNLKWFFGDIETFLNNIIADNSLNGTWLNFPDPWPKRKDTHNRIINLVFLEKLYAKTKLGGFFFLVTDHHGFLSYSLDLLDKHGKWIPDSDELYTNSHPDFPKSLFEEKWRSQGKYIYYSRFKKFPKEFIF
jgi:tRNA (guanine-N7-)-methyltransferase